jgi:hypothetical protein
VSWYALLDEFWRYDCLMTVDSIYPGRMVIPHASERLSLNSSQRPRQPSQSESATQPNVIPLRYGLRFGRPMRDNESTGIDVFEDTTRPTSHTVTQYTYPVAPVHIYRKRSLGSLGYHLSLRQIRRTGTAYPITTTIYCYIPIRYATEYGHQR